MVFFLCSILGGILLVAGLYSVLWCKSKEKETKTIPVEMTGQGKDEKELTTQVVWRQLDSCMCGQDTHNMFLNIHESTKFPFDARSVTRPELFIDAY